MSTHTQSTPIYQAPVFPDGKLATFISLSIHLCLKVVSRKGIVSELFTSANANASMSIRLDIHLYFFSTQSHHWWLDLGPGSSRRRHYSQHQCKYPTEFYHVIQCWTRKYTPRVPPHRWPLESISKACCRTARVRSSTSNKASSLRTNIRHLLEHATVFSMPHLDPFFPLLSGEFMLVHHPTQGKRY